MGLKSSCFEQDFEDNFEIKYSIEQQKEENSDDMPIGRDVASSADLVEIDVQMMDQKNLQVLPTAIANYIEVRPHFGAQNTAFTELPSLCHIYQLVELNSVIWLTPMELQKQTLQIFGKKKRTLENKIQLRDELRKLFSVYSRKLPLPGGIQTEFMNPLGFSTIWRQVTLKKGNLYEEMALFHKFDVSNKGILSEDDFVQGWLMMAKERMSSDEILRVKALSSAPSPHLQRTVELGRFI